VIVAAAVCPHPPLLVPGVAPGTDDELAELRSACLTSVLTVLATEPARVVVVGPGDLAHDLDERAGGTLAGFGVDVRAGGDEVVLPLSLTIGAWLLDRAGWTGARTYSTGRPAPSAGEEDVVLLVMADGTTTRTEKAPGFLDERSAPFDAALATALGTGDAEALTRLDAGLGAELGSSGVPSLHVLGELVRAETTKGATVAAQVRYDGAPLGVGYVVADWVLSR
jgi:aromatic ring-opening dioxygenase LigB subunit